MDYIKGVNFAPFASKGAFSNKESFQSLENLVMRTNANYIFFVPNGLQDTPQSIKIDYSSDATCSDEELEKMIMFAKGLGMHTVLKPTVNCRNGSWRAHISFFDEDVVCEPKWSEWFEAYTQFQLHYAAMAEKLGCDMFVAGCEMVMSEHREIEWRQLIQDIRTVYHGPISYNTDKYQEHNVAWWDAVDIISSSGYYPVSDWNTQLNRIEKVVRKYKKPFFFSEMGCMSTQHSKNRPNDWTIRGEVDLEGQAEWYRKVFGACNTRSWVNGFAIWDWSCKPYILTRAENDPGYNIYGKPAEKVVAAYYSQH